MLIDEWLHVYQEELNLQNRSITKEIWHFFFIISKGSSDILKHVYSHLKPNRLKMKRSWTIPYRI